MFKKILVILFMSLLPNATLANNASDLYNNEDYDAAYRAAYADALLGDPESSFIIGQILIDGKGSANENISKGIEFIKSSAKSDYLKAVDFLAVNYEEGKYSSENKTLALEYYEQAEKLGNKEAEKKVTEF